MAKTKRYNGEEESLTGADRDYGGSSGGDEYAPAPEPEKKQTFKEAFAAAKKGDTFTWQGKKYIKEFAGEKKSSPATPKSEPVKPTVKVESPKTSSAKVAEPSSSARVGRAGQASAMSSAMREPDQEKMDMASLKRIKQREEMLDTPVARMFKAIRSRGESGAPAYAKGGMTASKRADGIAQRGKTRGKMC